MEKMRAAASIGIAWGEKQKPYGQATESRLQGLEDDLRVTFKV